MLQSNGNPKILEVVILMSGKIDIKAKTIPRHHTLNTYYIILLLYYYIGERVNPQKNITNLNISTTNSRAPKYMK